VIASVAEFLRLFWLSIVDAIQQWLGGAEPRDEWRA